MAKLFLKHKNFFLKPSFGLLIPNIYGFDMDNNYDLKIINQIESSIFPKAKVLCEPNLGKRDLYPTLSQKGKYGEIKLRMDLLAYSDGSKSLEFISDTVKKPLKAHSETDHHTGYM